MAATQLNFLRSLVDLVAAEEAIAPRTVLEQTGLTLKELDQLGNAVELGQVMRTYDRIAALSTQRGIGFRSPAVNLGDQGLLGAAILMSGTVDDALKNLQQYGDLLNVIVRYEVFREDGHYVVRTIPRLRPSAGAYQVMTEENLAIWKCASLPLANLEQYLEAIWIDYPAPAHSAMYEALFPNCSVCFDKPHFQAVLRDEAAAQVLPTSNPAALKEIEQLCADVIERMTPSTANRVRSYLAQADSANWSVLQIALALGTTEKTLGRRLETEGVRPRDLVTEHRYSRAMECLDRDCSAEVTAARVGYKDADSFRKAFKRWSGMTVKDYQRRRAVRS